MQLVQYSCDVCGAKKGEANKWWVVFPVEVNSKRAALVGPIEEADTLQKQGQATTLFHVCGEGCLHRKLSEVLFTRLKAIAV